jgi:hypothetical protein
MTEAAPHAADLEPLADTKPVAGAVLARPFAYRLDHKQTKLAGVVPRCAA